MSIYIVILVVILGIVALVQLAGINDLSSKLRGKMEEGTPERDNHFNSRMWIVFGVIYFGGTIYLMATYGNGMGIVASEHGETIDWLFNFNWAILFVVFFLTHILLFGFAYKYYHRKDRKAFYHTHNNKLELLWTAVPAVVLTIIIIFGLTTWNRVTSKASEDAIVIELYSEQFSWTARYPGKDGKLGKANFNLISTVNGNGLGIATPTKIADKLAEVDATISELKKFRNENWNALSKGRRKKWLDDVQHYNLHRLRILSINAKDKSLLYGGDDILVKGEFHIPVGKEIAFEFRSKDVIHSAFMYDFRAQMNTVPGTTTKFKFTPTKTTEEMRDLRGDEEFNYMLLCNKVCGVSHYNMIMTIVVETEEEYSAWLGKQKIFEAEKSAESSEQKKEVTEENSGIATL